MGLYKIAELVINEYYDKLDDFFWILAFILIVNS